MKRNGPKVWIHAHNSIKAQDKLGTELWCAVDDLLMLYYGKIRRPFEDEYDALAAWPFPKRVPSIWTLREALNGFFRQGEDGLWHPRPERVWVTDKDPYARLRRTRR